MNVKIDTKEKFTVITPEDALISVNMTEDLIKMLSAFMQKDIPHLVLNLKNISDIDQQAAEKLAMIQHQFYEHNYSFVICELQPAVEAAFEKMELLELLNVTPTESEAWDIVQMEEIERELFSGEDDATAE